MKIENYKGIINLPNRAEIPAKLSFLMNIFSLIIKFLTTFQAITPKIQLLYYLLIYFLLSSLAEIPVKISFLMGIFFSVH